MRLNAYEPSRPHLPNDVGTLWTMRRMDGRARCALLSVRDGWEAMVIADNEIILREPCAHASDAFAVAEQWKHRMTADGWRQVVPDSRRR